MFSFFNQYEQPVNVTIQLLKQLKVKVTSTTVNETILNHPDYPSILSLSDALNTWHVENAAIKIEPDKLTELPLPFIAFTNTNSVFVLITEIKNDKVFYLDESNKTKSKKLAAFLKEFKGVVLLAQKTETSGETDYTKAKRKENIVQLKIPAFISIGILLIAAAIINNSIINNFSAAFSLLLVLKFCGLLVTTLLLWYEADKANPALQKICTGGGKTNCNAILNSKEAKLFSWLSWSEIGFFYFAGGFLFVIASATKQSALSTLQLIQLLNFLALPYVFFSIYYQWRIAKQWCPLCLTVQAILVLEFITAISYQPLAISIVSSLSSVIGQLSTLLLSFALPVITWFIIKPLLHNQQKAKQDFRSLQRFKFNNEIFYALLYKQKQITEPTDGLGITLGNADAANTLIKVCNPYCGPCAKAHSEIEKLLEENKNLKVQIIFTATNDENDSRALPVKHLLAVAAKQDETLTKKALDDWYLAERKNYEIFAAKYEMNGELKERDGKIKEMSEWCNKVEIAFTPTIFVSVPSLQGRVRERLYQLPDAYSIGDLKYFLTE